MTLWHCPKSWAFGVWAISGGSGVLKQSLKSDFLCRIKSRSVGMGRWVWRWLWILWLPSPTRVTDLLAPKLYLPQLPTRDFTIWATITLLQQKSWLPQNCLKTYVLLVLASSSPHVIFAFGWLESYVEAFNIWPNFWEKAFVCCTECPGALSESNTWDSELLKIKLENFSRKTDVSRNCEVSDWIIPL